MPPNDQKVNPTNNEENGQVFSNTLASTADEENTNLLRNRLASFESLPSRKEHEAFLRECIEIIFKEAVFNGTLRQNKVVEFQQPEDLLKIFDFQITENPSNHIDLINSLRDVIKYSVKTGHPYFVNQLFSSIDPYGLVGQMLTDALNPSAYTYEVAPVIILMEEIVLKEMRQIIGWPNGEGDGIFCPGGSIANGYGISCARHYFHPDIKKKGLHGLPKLVLFTSEDAHYSIRKLASLLGIGTENVILIQTDTKGKMDTNHLEQRIKDTIGAGMAPFMVAATTGTTVFGAFDPIEEISTICEKYKLWLHVDAAWGGGALVSKKHRNLLKGIERADSVTWNPHKLLTAPQQCSTFLLRYRNILSDAHSANASYLFQKDKFYSTKYDTGDKHIQCGRKADVLKFWFMWRAKGTNGFEKHVDKTLANAKYFYNTIKNHRSFELVMPEPQFTNICFWYIPPSLRTSSREEFALKIEKDESYRQKIHAVAPKIKERMMKEGTMMVTYQAQKNWPNFFRMVFQNSGLNENDMLHFIEEFERLGADL